MVPSKDDPYFTPPKDDPPIAFEGNCCILCASVYYCVMVMHCVTA